MADMPASCERPIGGAASTHLLTCQVVAAGRRKHFYVFDLAAAAVERVAGLTGRPERSLESFAACSAADNPLVAFLGNQVPCFRETCSGSWPLSSLAGCMLCLGEGVGHALSMHLFQTSMVSLNCCVETGVFLCSCIPLTPCLQLNVV